MALDLADKLEQYQNAFFDNLDYDVVDDISKAKLFVAACRGLIPLLQEQTQQASRFMVRMGINVETVQQENLNAKKWIADRPGGATNGSVRGFSVRGFRY